MIDYLINLLYIGDFGISRIASSTKMTGNVGTEFIIYFIYLFIYYLFFFC
jgi:hypothetical protein